MGLSKLLEMYLVHLVPSHSGIHSRLEHMMGNGSGDERTNICSWIGTYGRILIIQSSENAAGILIIIHNAAEIPFPGILEDKIY